MDVKFGKIKPNGVNLFSQASTAAVNPHSNANLFGETPDRKKDNTPQSEPQISRSRINDFDSNILENNAYQDIKDEMFKIEHKINILENTLSKINNEIEALESLGQGIQISDLRNRKEKLEQELAELNKQYAELGLSAKISGKIASVVNFTSNKKNSSFSRFKKFISKKILARLSKQFNCNQEMKEALEKLSNINSSVDELINLQVPYGETIARYEKLTAYLNKANVIHSQINRNLSSTNKKKS